ncbi:MAG: VanZ family protein, partial [Acidobacteria bacterium]|nr:VanZ family protein [Candidatus Sulfomarinibacter sp. MAG AM1]
MGQPEEAVHFLEYGVLGVLLFRALSTHIHDGSVFAAGALIGILVGIFDEIIQWFVPGRYWSKAADGRIQCDLCPRHCHLKEGQRGLCYVRQRLDDEVKLVSYGRYSGFCVDPIEKKPLNHFYPGSAVLSFGTAGCNLACKFCQNWDMS